MGLTPTCILILNFETNGLSALDSCSSQRPFVLSDNQPTHQPRHSCELFALPFLQPCYSKHRCSTKKLSPLPAMLTVLTTASGICSLLFVVLGLWLSYWAHQRFGIVTLLWIVTTKIAGAASGFAVPSATEAVIKLSIAPIQRVLGVTLGQAIAVYAMIPTFFELASMLCLLVVLAGELGHFGPDLEPSYAPHPLLKLAYRIRHFVGAFAILLAIVPAGLLAIMLHLGNQAVTT